MKTIHYLAIAIRLFAIALFVYGLRSLISIAASYNWVVDNNVSLFAAIIFSIIPLLLAVITWFFPLTLAKKIFPDESKVLEPMPSTTLFTILILAIGICTFYFAVCDAFYWVIYYLMFTNQEFGFSLTDAFDQNFVAMITTVFEFIISLFLIFKAKTIASWSLKVAR